MPADGNGNEYSQILHRIERWVAVVAIGLAVIAASSVFVAYYASTALSAVQYKLEERSRH